MGWAVVAGAAVTAGQQLLSSQQGSKDSDRFAKAQQWYQLAIAGDSDALNALKFMSGRYGASTCGRFGACSGFATQAAKDYSGRLYDQAVAVISGSQSPMTPVPAEPPPSTPPVVQGLINIGQAANTAAAASGANVPLTPSQAQAQTIQQQGMLLWLLVIAGGAFAAYKLARR